MTAQLQLPKISHRARRQLARASTIAAGGKYLGRGMRDRHKAKPITLRLAQLQKEPEHGRQ